MDTHLFVLYALKIFVLVFSGIAFVISLILLFSEKLFLKISSSLSQGSLESPTAFEKLSSAQNINQSIKTMGYLVLFLSVISLYYINKSFKIDILVKIFANNTSQTALAEIILKTFKYFLLSSLSFCLIIAFPMILAPSTFRRMEAFFQKKFDISKAPVQQKVFNIDDMILKFHIPAGILTTILSAYIFFVALTRFQIK